MYESVPTEEAATTQHLSLSKLPTAVLFFQTSKHETGSNIGSPYANTCDGRAKKTSTDSAHHWKEMWCQSTNQKCHAFVRCDYTRAWTAKWAESSISPRQHPYTTDSPRQSLAGRLAHYQNHSPSQEWVFLILNHFLSHRMQCSIHAACNSFVSSYPQPTAYSTPSHPIFSPTKNATFSCQCTSVSFRRHDSNFLNIHSICIFCSKLWLYSSSKQLASCSFWRVKHFEPH